MVDYEKIMKDAEDKLKQANLNQEDLMKAVEQKMSGMPAPEKMTPEMKVVAELGKILNEVFPEFAQGAGMYSGTLFGMMEGEEERINKFLYRVHLYLKGVYGD